MIKTEKKDVEERYEGGSEGENRATIIQTIRHRQTLKSHPRCRCTPQRYDVTGWQPRRLLCDPSSPVPAVPPPSAG